MKAVVMHIIESSYPSGTRYICELRCGMEARRKVFKSRKTAIGFGKRMIGNGTAFDWIVTKKKISRKRTSWSEEHKQVKAVPGWRGRVMIGGYSK